MDDFFSISSSVLPGDARVIAFRGTEAISQPYQFEIYVTIRAAELDSFDLGDAIGAKATLTLDRASDTLPPYYFSGILFHVDLVHAVDGFALLRLVLVPRLWLLSLSKHSRIFTKRSITDILKAVLEENGLGPEDYALQLGSYETEEHICQYRESDLDFLSRWMEREGIFYYFEHEEGGEKLILCDSLSYPPDLLGNPIPYHPQLGQDRSAGLSFRSFIGRHATLPASIKLRDYDYARPNLQVSGSAPISHSGAGEINLYGERFFNPAAGERLAQLRAQELKAREVEFHASGTRTHLRSGHTFELEEHPRASWNSLYLVTEAKHWGNHASGASSFKQLIGLEHDDVYHIEISAIPAKTQFRARSLTPWPRIYGYENGIVDGAADSEYAQIDDHGRYNVKFRFDESNLKGGMASTFVRMMQPHGGSVEGFHFPLRKGTEVMISFLGGDPDRPVISGVVPNALTPSPVTVNNYTTNIIQTGARNRIEMEDRSGQERVTISTPHSNTYVQMGAPSPKGPQLTLFCEDDGNMSVMSFDLDVGFNKKSIFEKATKPKSWSADIKKDWDTVVHEGDYTLTVKKGTSSTTVKGDTSLRVEQGKLETIVELGNMSTSVEAGKIQTMAAMGSGLHVKLGGIQEVVDIGPRVTHLKGGSFKVQADAGALGGGDVYTKAEKETKIESGQKISILSTKSDVYIEAENVTTKSRAAKQEFITWQFSFNAGIQTSITLGFSQSLTISDSLSITIGRQRSVTIAKQDSINIGGGEQFSISATTSFSLGLKLGLELSLSITIGAAFSLNLVPTSMAQKVADIKQSLSNIKINGFTVIT